MSNVSVVKKDFSHLFDLNDLLEFIDFDRLQYYHISFNGSIIAIATNSTLILTSYYNDNYHNHKDDDNDLVLINCSDNGDNADVGDDGINLVIEFNNSDQNKPTCLEWIYDDIICVGFQSGRIICFNSQGIELFVFNTSQSSPSVSSSSSSMTSSVENIKLGISMSNDNYNHHELSSIWVICRNGLLVCIPLSNILEQKKSLIKAYQLTSQSSCRDVVFYPYMNTSSPSSSSLFDIIAQMEMDNNIHDDDHDGDDGSRYDHDVRAFDDGYTSRHSAIKRSRLIMTGSFHVIIIMSLSPTLSLSPSLSPSSSLPYLLVLVGGSDHTLSLYNLKAPLYDPHIFTDSSTSTLSNPLLSSSSTEAAGSFVSSSVLSSLLNVVTTSFMYSDTDIQNNNSSHTTSTNSPTRGSTAANNSNNSVVIRKSSSSKSNISSKSSSNNNSNGYDNNTYISGSDSYYHLHSSTYNSKLNNNHHKQSLSTSVTSPATTFSSSSSSSQIQIDLDIIDHTKIDLSSAISFIDSKRKVVSMSMDPTSLLVAVADSLGRVR